MNDRRPGETATRQILVDALALAVVAERQEQRGDRIETVEELEAADDAHAEDLLAWAAIARVYHRNHGPAALARRIDDRPRVSARPYDHHLVRACHERSESSQVRLRKDDRRSCRAMDPATGGSS